MLSSRIFSTPLLVERVKLGDILFALGPRLNLDLSEVERGSARAYGPGDPERREPYYVDEQGVAVIGIVGPLVARESGDFLSGGPTTYSQIQSWVERAVMNPEITGIVLDMDSPGGEAGGAFDLSDMIYAAREKKPIFAVANHMAYSAGFAIASACSRVYVTRTGGVGSVGVVMVHVDQSGLNEKVGIKPTFIFAGRKKIQGNPHEPLADDARKDFQDEIDYIDDMFCKTVSRNREMGVEAVKGTEAGCFLGKRALSIGFADRVGTLEDAMADIRVEARKFSKRTASAAATSHKGAITMQTMEETQADAVDTQQPPVVDEKKEATEPQVSPEPQPKPDPAPAQEPVAAAVPAVPVTQLVDAARAAGYDDAGKILKLCQHAGKLHLAAGFIEKKMSLEGAKGALLDAFILDTEKTDASLSHASASPLPLSTEGGNQLEAKANAIAKERKVSKERALVIACEEDPKLYQQYISAQRA